MYPIRLKITMTKKKKAAHAELGRKFDAVARVTIFAVHRLKSCSCSKALTNTPLSLDLTNCYSCHLLSHAITRQAGVQVTRY